MSEPTLPVEPWEVWFLNTLIAAVACGALLRARIGRRVGPPANNPFHSFGEKVVAGWVPVLVATLASATLLRHEARTANVLCAVFALAVVGAIDDWRPYTPLGKLSHQLPIFVFVTLTLPPFVEPDALSKRVLAHLLHGLFLIVATNSLNVLDVADGLAPCVAALALGATAVLLEASGNRSGALIAASFGGATVGFLGFNAAGTVVLGDAGSLALGGLLAIAIPLGAGRSGEAGVVAAALLLLVPLAEVVWLSVRRLMEGIPPWRASSHHLAYCLVRRGWIAEQAVALLVGVQVLAAAAALWLSGMGTGHPWIAGALFSTVVSPWLGLALRANASASSTAGPRRFEDGAS